MRLVALAPPAPAAGSEKPLETTYFCRNPAVVLAHPRWEFVFQPKYAAYLNLIEPWWKVLRSLALKGRRFETFDEVKEAVEKATGYWNDHRHLFRWGQKRRHRPKRKPGYVFH